MIPAGKFVPIPARHETAFKSTMGKTHTVNQDAVGVWTREHDGAHATLMIVADGVSAGRHSEVASRLAVEIVSERILPAMERPALQGEALLSKLLDACSEAASQVAGRPHRSTAEADATTLVAAACVGAEVVGIWCGDSRAYQATAQIQQLTRDHSWVEMAVESGVVTHDQARLDPRAHMITRWLGPPGGDNSVFDTFKATLAPGDVLACCTDGLYMYFDPPHGDERELNRILTRRSSSLSSRVGECTAVAAERGGRDDITLACLQVTPA